MGVDVRHDHAFQVPRPDLAEALGTRDVCTGCHQGKTSAWAAQVISDRYGLERTRGPHWAQSINSAREGEATALESLFELTEAGAAPDIVRATAVKLAARYGEGASAILLRASKDSSPLVRNAAAWAYSHGPEDEKLKGLPALLSDPYRSVRAAAGRGLASFPPEVLGQEVSALRDRALSEYELAQESLFDLPSGRFNQAVLHVEQGEYEEARSRYEQAIAMDPRFLPAIANLAQLESALGARDEAERVLRTGLEALPSEGELHYSLGLILAEKGAREDSASALARAAVLLPQRARVQYNHGLAEQHLGHVERAAAAFRNAAEIEPLNPAFVRALAILYAQNGRWIEANRAARTMMELEPDSPGNRALFQRIQSELKLR
jgi:tetratricopeptide (TPR) repeat protein